MIGRTWQYALNALKLLNKRNRSKPRRNPLAAALRPELLEQRCLLAVTGISFDADAGRIVIQGDYTANQATVVADGPSTITVRLEAAEDTFESSFQRSDVSSVTFFGGNGDDRFENFTDLPSNAWGGAGNDTLIGGFGDDVLDGGNDDDLLAGEGGNDELHGEAGNDLLYGGDGHDLLSGNLGDDQLWGGADDDFLDGGVGNDYLYGEDGQDELRGGSENDVLLGGFGDDVLYGGSEDDVLVGEDGNDTLYGESGNDWLYGGTGEDRLFGGTDDDQLWGGADDDFLDGGDGNDQLHGEGGNDKLQGRDGTDLLQGGSGGDVLTGGPGDDVLAGGDGNDELNGESGNDSLYGGNGNDSLFGNSDEDQLWGGADDDFLDGGVGNDYLYGEDGQDELRGGSENDVLLGGFGDDVLYGGSEDDVLVGEDGNDTLYGESGNDWQYGGTGEDRLFGGTDDDQLWGGADDDFLDGGDGNDQLHGEGGNDHIYGRNGDDLLLGGSGDNYLAGGDGNDVLVGGDGIDILDGDSDRDVLIGGMSLDSLNGRAGDDVLIGGATLYDNDVNKLRLLASVWGSDVPYATRIQVIEHELFTARLESEETVFDDQVADSVFGGGGEDWFFQTGSMPYYTPLTGEAGADRLDGASHHHSGDTVVHELPLLEGFDLIDSLDKFGDVAAGEVVHSKLPHAGDSVKQPEHLALFELARYDQVTHYAVQSGAWSDPDTWHDGILPSAGARVLIPIGTRVVVDTVVTTELATVRVDGTLAFATSENSELRVDTIVVSGAGAFEMGTEAQPVEAGVTARLLITDNGPIDRSWDPFGISRGLLSHGKVTIYGAEKQSFVAAAGEIIAGTQAVPLAAIPTGWQVGDTVVIAGTAAGAQQNEVRTVLGFAGPYLILDQPLLYDHIPPSSELQVHVANTTRNAVIESATTDVLRRGHTMFMHNRDVDVNYAGFYRLGRTNKLEPINDPVVDENWVLQPGTGTNPRARYPVHFHRNGIVDDGNPAVIHGSAVVDSPGWGYVNHSSYVEMTDNVAFDVDGAAFSTEVGDEIGSFQGNIAIGSVGSGEAINGRESIQDFGHQGDGFWFQAAGISVTENVSAGNTGNAFVFYSRGLIESGGQGRFLAENLPQPSIANGAKTIDTRHVPVIEFRGNVGYASGVGLNIRYHLRDADHNQYSVFSDSSFWNNSLGVDLNYSHQIILQDLQVIDASGEFPHVGIEMNAVTRNVVYDNLTVTGYSWGIRLPVRGFGVVNGGYYDNRQDFIVDTGISPDRLVVLQGSIGFGDAAGGLQFEVTMRPNYNLLGGHGTASYAFSPDTVILNYGPFVNQRAYYSVQAASAVPFPVPQVGIPDQYIGLTNQQLWDQFGIAIGGEVAPADAGVVPNIAGLVAPSKG